MGVAVFCACVLLRLLQPRRHSREVHVLLVGMAWPATLQEAPGACDDSLYIHRPVCVLQRGTEQHGKGVSECVCVCVFVCLCVCVFVCVSVCRQLLQQSSHTHTLSLSPSLSLSLSHCGCVEQVETKSPVVFKSDAWPSVFMLLLALSNGYLGNLCMEYGPQ